MNAHAKFQKLASEIRQDFPSAHVVLDDFPSGVYVVDVSLNGRNFELEYSPKRGTGVSENFEDTPPFIGHDKTFDSLDLAIHRLKDLLASAARGEKAPRTAAMALHDKSPPTPS